MNQTNFDDNLVKNLDLINFWEPFQREHPNLKVGIRAILKDLKAKKIRVNRAADKVAQIKLTDFNKPIVISYNTINQKAAINELCHRLENGFNLISESETYQPEQLPEDYILSQALYYKWSLMKWFFQFKGYDKKVFESRFYNFYKRLGQYRHYHRSFSAAKGQIKCYIATNDHSGLSQVGFVAARNAGIPTIYIQHASVSDRFPPLRSTYAFLDGEDTRQKYLAAGPTDTHIELVGIMKYDPYLQSPEINKPGPLIGICLGLTNCDLDENVALCQKLTEAKRPFCLRFHPQMGEASMAKFKNRGWEFSDPRTESAPDFILRCHSIISPDSNIHLEAVILKRRPIYLAPADGAIDYYDFVKNGVLEPAVHTSGQVISKLNTPYEMDSYRRKAKHYHAGLYTDWEGKSTEKIEMRIREISGAINPIK